MASRRICARKTHHFIRRTFERDFCLSSSRLLFPALLIPLLAMTHRRGIGGKTEVATAGVQVKGALNILREDSLCGLRRPLECRKPHVYVGQTTSFP